MNLEQWIKTHTFHHSRFQDKKRLVRLKEEKKLRISLAFPTLNEAETIGKIIVTIRGELQSRFPLLDEIAIIDSGSEDKTREIAAEFGAQVYLASECLPEHGSHRGKGENLWKSLYLLSGDIIVWIDADITNIHPKFVYGVVGPLLEDDRFGYVKAFYERPYRSRDRITRAAGGRVTEILVRPLFNLFYPELTALFQPLSGEYAGRREILEGIPFSVGYGVETGHLLDISRKFGMDVLAQVDLERRIHKHQDLPALRKMSFAILQTFCARLSDHQKVEFKEQYSNVLRTIGAVDNKYFAENEVIEIIERPPMITIPEYLEKRKHS
jgi:glucosyl-3-phosphoglycerate synthase